MIEFPVAFHFVVMIKSARTVTDNAFQEVSGLEAELEVETVQEGGENRFVHRLPKVAKHPNLVLKRGIARVGSGLTSWCKEVLEGGLEVPIKPLDIDVSLLNEHRIPTVVWSVSRAWPVKWSVGSLDAAKNELAIESIELAYHTCARRTF